MREVRLQNMKAFSVFVIQEAARCREKDITTENSIMLGKEIRIKSNFTCANILPCF